MRAGFGVLIHNIVHAACTLRKIELMLCHPGGWWSCVDGVGGGGGGWDC